MLFIIYVNATAKTALFLFSQYTQKRDAPPSRTLSKYVIHLSNMFEIPDMTNYRAILSNRPQTIYSKFKISYGLLLSQEQESPETMVEFVKKSIVQSDISKEIKGVEHELEQANAKVAKNQELLKTSVTLTKEDYRKIKELDCNIQAGLYKTSSDGEG